MLASKLTFGRSDLNFYFDGGFNYSDMTSDLYDKFIFKSLFYYEYRKCIETV